MLSGYRVFSRRFVKSFPAISRAFEIETELTVHAINNRVPQAEVPVGFKDRAEGSASKLRTYHDGFRIVRMITRLLHHERPLALYSTIAALIVLVRGRHLGIPVIAEYLQHRPRRPLPHGLPVGLARHPGVHHPRGGILLDGLRKVRQETTRIAYMATPPPPYLRRSARLPTPAGAEVTATTGGGHRGRAGHGTRRGHAGRSRAVEHQRRRRRVRRRTRARGVPVVDP